MAISISLNKRGYPGDTPRAGLLHLYLFYNLWPISTAGFHYSLITDFFIVKHSIQKRGIMNFNLSQCSFKTDAKKFSQTIETYHSLVLNIANHTGCLGNLELAGHLPFYLYKMADSEFKWDSKTILEKPNVAAKTNADKFTIAPWKQIQGSTTQISQNQARDRQSCRGVCIRANDQFERSVLAKVRIWQSSALPPLVHSTQAQRAWQISYYHWNWPVTNEASLWSCGNIPGFHDIHVWL